MKKEYSSPLFILEEMIPLQVLAQSSVEGSGQDYEDPVIITEDPF